MHDNTEQPVKIDVYADIACPWCYIGLSRLNAAIVERPAIKVERHWQPFQLRPEMPMEGIEWDEFVETKFGGAVRAEVAFERVSEASAPDGIRFRFDLVKRAPNTQDAHRLVLFAARQEREWETACALYSAYFEQGRDINDQAVLIEIAAQLGFDKEQVAAYLQGEENREAVRTSQVTAHQLGITGVPFYVLNDRYGISGAQPVELFVAALDRLGQVQSVA
jgi:predicted DsbA family dithiol-disulfide isomerase